MGINKRTITMRKTYGDYDYETEYKKQITNLEEFEYRRMLGERKVPYLYTTKTITSGKMVEVEIYPVFHKKKDMPAKKVKKTRKAQQNLNDKNARKTLTRKINANFGEGDFWCTFNLSENPDSYEEVYKIMKNYIRRLNYRRKKEGLPNVKCIYVVEIGKGGRAHVHAVMDGMLDRDTVEDLWKHGKRNHVRRLEPDDFSLTGLATYISKDPQGRKRWSSTKNLKEPKITKSVTKFKRGRILKMARNQNLIEQELKKEYPKLKYLDAEVRTNDINSMFYVYARMVRQE